MAGRCRFGLFYCMPCGMVDCLGLLFFRIDWFVGSACLTLEWALSVKHEVGKQCTFVINNATSDYLIKYWVRFIRKILNIG